MKSKGLIGLRFGAAIEWLRQGEKVRRASWPKAPKTQFVRMIKSADGVSLVDNQGKDWLPNLDDLLAQEWAIMEETCQTKPQYVEQEAKPQPKPKRRPRSNEN